MKFDMFIDYHKGLWTVFNRQNNNDWQVSFNEYEDAHKFMLDIVMKVVNNG